MKNLLLLGVLCVAFALSSHAQPSIFDHPFSEEPIEAPQDIQPAINAPAAAPVASPVTQPVQPPTKAPAASPVAPPMEPVTAPVQPPIPVSFFSPQHQSPDGTCPRAVDPMSPQFQVNISSFRLTSDQIELAFYVPYDQSDPWNPNHAVSTSYTWVQQQNPPQPGSNLACSAPGSSVLFFYENSFPDQYLCANYAYFYGSFAQARDQCGIFARQETVFDITYSAQLRIQRLYNVRNGRISGQRTAESVHNLAVSFPKLRTASTSSISIIGTNGQNDFASNLIFTSLVYNGVRWVGTVQTSTLAPLRVAPIDNGTIFVYSAFSGVVATVSNISDCIGPNSVECRQEFAIEFNPGCDALAFTGSNYLYVLPNTFSYSCYPSALPCPYPTPTPISTTTNTLEIYNIRTSSACAVTRYDVVAPTPFLNTFDGQFTASKSSFMDGDIVGLRLFLQSYAYDSSIIATRVLSVSADTLGNLNLPTNANGSVVPVVGSSFCPQQANIVCIQINTSVPPFATVPLNSVRYYTFNVTYEVIFQGSQQAVRRAVFEQQVRVDTVNVPASVVSRPAATDTNSPSRPLRASAASKTTFPSLIVFIALSFLLFALANPW